MTSFGRLQLSTRITVSSSCVCFGDFSHTFMALPRQPVCLREINEVEIRVRQDTPASESTIALNVWPPRPC